MTRGNWQKRVESAEARRKEAKQRKQKVADHRTVKQYAGDLIQYGSSSALDSPVTVFWEGVPPDDILLLSSSPSSSKHRSGRARSNSNASDSGGKKAHPRSRKNSITKEDEAVEAPVMMCRSYFFTGKCPKPCPWPHTSCLHSLLTSIPSKQYGEDPSAITMTSLNSLRVVECLTTTLAQHEVKSTDIVYAVQDKALIYDRNDGGLLVQHSSQSSSRFSPVASSLPGMLLRHVIAFLPDESVASMNAVCRDWHVAVNDPLVWKFLLQRNEWPGNTYADYFAHAAVVRDVQLVADAVAPSDRVVFVTEYQPNQALVICRDGEAILYDGKPRVLLRTSLDPYKNTKKRNIEVLAAALGDSVALLCRVTTPNTWKVAYVLVLKHRDAFLLDDEDDTDSTLVIDIGEATLNHLLSLEVVDHRIFRLMDFLQSHGFGEVEVQPSNTLASCGHGRFLVHVSISIPVDGVNDASIVIDQRLLLFSADAILWVADSDDERVHDIQFRDNFVSTCSDRGVSHGEILVGMARLGHERASSLRMTDDFIVGARTVAQASGLVESSLVFLPADGLMGQNHPVLSLGENLRIRGVTCIRGDHLLVICSEDAGEEPNEEEVDGQWFLPNSMDKAFIVHIPTQTVIRSILLEQSISEECCPVSMAHAIRTIAFAANEQIWMSGDNVREARAKDDAANQNSNKKKKRLRNRGGGAKKDGFARGMSLRG